MKANTASSLTTESPEKPIEFVDLRAQYARLKPEIDARIEAVIEHGRFIMGPEVAEFEAELARFAGCAEAIGVSSGTDALLMVLMEMGIGPGDAVFMPAFTFTATAEVVALLGASAMFVDVDSETFNIDPADLDQRVSKLEAEGQLRPRAVFAVDLFGMPADYAGLAEICDLHGLLLIADAAQSFGGSFGGRRVGALAPVTALSFFPAKPLGCYGDGGAVLTDDPERAARYRSIRAHGKGEAKYDIIRVGLNARLDTIQAAILLAKLPHLADEIEARERLALRYEARLGNLAMTPSRIEGATSAWAQYTLQLDRRDHVAAALKEIGIPTAIYYPKPLHLQPAYAQFGSGSGSLPVSEALCERVLSLPMHPDLDEATTARICDAIAKAVSG